MLPTNLAGPDVSTIEIASSSMSKCSTLSFDYDEGAWDTSRAKLLFPESPLPTESTSTCTKSKSSHSDITAAAGSTNNLNNFQSWANGNTNFPDARNPFVDNGADVEERTNEEPSRAWALSRIRYTLEQPATFKNKDPQIEGSRIRSTLGYDESNESDYPDESTLSASAFTSGITESDYPDESTLSASAFTSGISASSQSVSNNGSTSQTSTGSSNDTWSSGWTSIIAEENAPPPSFDSELFTDDNNSSLSRLEELSELDEDSIFADENEFTTSFESDYSSAITESIEEVPKPLLMLEELSLSSSFQHGSTWSLQSSTRNSFSETEFFPHVDVAAVSQTKPMLGLDQNTNKDANDESMHAVSNEEESNSKLTESMSGVISEPRPYTYAESIFRDQPMSALEAADVSRDNSFDSALSEARKELRLISIGDFQRDLAFVLNDLAMVFSFGKKTDCF